MGNVGYVSAPVMHAQVRVLGAGLAERKVAEPGPVHGAMLARPAAHALDAQHGGAWALRPGVAVVDASVRGILSRGGGSVEVHRLGNAPVVEEHTHPALMRRP